ncbi:MAG: substrate-binding domain-containing protein [Candidatus Symbiothrix sp.]|jgi:phosphate transport system substrate-binding protein|nr:substrate-binding domain-containing protein [Candidatus Symbiothrix sp.]
MKKTILFFAIIIGLSLQGACSDTTKEETNTIEGLSLENFPKMDGSTSCRHLNNIIACKLLDIPYKWQPPLVDEWTVGPAVWTQEYLDFFSDRVKTSQTHGAFINLIDGNADIILTHRTISPDEKARADEAGLTLIETPVAMDAFVFVVNKNNPVKSLTVEQVQKIYTGEITNWAQVGGNNASMKVFTRPRNSGSEEVMRELVMNDLEMADFPESSIGQMVWVFTEVINNPEGICYTFNNYKDLIARKSDDVVPKIAINDIFPDENTVRNQTYPFISAVHVAIRSDLDHNSMAYKLYEYLQTDAAKSIYTESGFVPKTNANAIRKMDSEAIRISTNPVKDYLYIQSGNPVKKAEIYNQTGQLVLSKSGTARKINVSALSAGMYILRCDGNNAIKFLKQ